MRWIVVAFLMLQFGALLPASTKEDREAAIEDFAYKLIYLTWIEWLQDWAGKEWFQNQRKGLEKQEMTMERSLPKMKEQKEREKRDKEARPKEVEEEIINEVRYELEEPPKTQGEERKVLEEHDRKEVNEARKKIEELGNKKWEGEEELEKGIEREKPEEPKRLEGEHKQEKERQEKEES